MKHAKKKETHVCYNHLCNVNDFQGKVKKVMKYLQKFVSWIKCYNMVVPPK